MKYLISVLLLCILFLTANSQPPANDNYSNAVAMIPPSIIFGSTINATESLSPEICAVVPSVALDTWFKFLADGNSGFTITALKKSGTDLVVALYALNSGNLTYVTCDNSVGSDKCELNIEVLPAGIYYYRIYAMWGTTAKFKTILQKNSDNNFVSNESIYNTAQKPDDLQKGNVSVYPNPLSSTVTISFSIPETEKVTIIIYDLSGNIINLLADELMIAGDHQFVWNAGNNNGVALEAGMYILKLSSQNFTQTQKVIVSN